MEVSYVFNKTQQCQDLSVETELEGRAGEIGNKAVAGLQLKSTKA
jgi:hypothetical protein